MYKQTGSSELKSEFEFYLIPHAQLHIWENSLAKSEIWIFMILDTLRSNYDEKLLLSFQIFWSILEKGLKCIGISENSIKTS